MNLANIRTLTRLRIQEAVADEWQDSDVNTKINEALSEIETKILRINHEAFIFTSIADVVAGQQLYDKPPGFFYEIALKLSDGSSPPNYAPMKYISYAQAMKNLFAPTLSGVASPGVQYPSTKDPSQAVYSHFGTSFYLTVNPLTSLAAGLKCEYVPILSLAVDTDVPPIHVSLHKAIAYKAAILCLQETGEPSDVLKADLQELMGDLGLYYTRQESTNDGMQADISKGY